jgi:hypothetical protein
MSVARIGIALWMLASTSLRATEPVAPYTVAAGVFDIAQPDLGLSSAPGTETVTIFKPGSGDKFSNGVVLMPFDGRLFAQWQSSPRDEDTADTWVAFARPRVPLAITLSRDGRAFERAFLLRGQQDLQPLRHEGQYKRPGYHYPKSVIWKDHLYVAYATNKEDVQLTRVPLASLR